MPIGIVGAPAGVTYDVLCSGEHCSGLVHHDALLG